MFSFRGSLMIHLYTENLGQNVLTPKPDGTLSIISANSQAYSRTATLLKHFSEGGG
jgi:hypothetical protein